MDQVVGPKSQRSARPMIRSFAREVYQKVDSGEEIKMCMQCGVCAASCPLERKNGFFSPKDFYPDPGRTKGKGAEQPGHYALHLLLFL